MIKDLLSSEEGRAWFRISAFFIVFASMRPTGFWDTAINRNKCVNYVHSSTIVATINLCSNKSSSATLSDQKQPPSRCWMREKLR